MFERCFDQPTTKPSSSTWQMSPAGQRLLIIMNQVSWQLFHVNANSKDKAPRGKWGASPPQPILPGRSQTPRDQHYGNTPGYVLRGTMGSGLGHVQHIPTYSNIFQHIPSYSNIFQHIPTCLQTGKDEMKSRRPFLWPIGSCASIMLQRETCWRPCRPAICRAWPDFLFHLAITKKTSCSPHNQETNIILTTLTLTTSIPSSTPEFLNLLLESN